MVISNVGTSSYKTSDLNARQNNFQSDCLRVRSAQWNNVKLIDPTHMFHELLEEVSMFMGAHKTSCQPHNVGSNALKACIQHIICFIIFLIYTRKPQLFFSSVSRIKILAVAILTLISFQKFFTNFFCMILILVAENAIFYMYVHRDNFFFSSTDFLKCKTAHLRILLSMNNKKCIVE